MSATEIPRTVEEAAELLLAHENAVSTCDPITDKWSDLDVDTAYHIQDRTLEMRRRRGETLVGIKLGLTSVAKQKQMGVAEPITAWLTDAMERPAGSLSLHGLIHPRAEPEIVFVLGQQLAGPGVTSAKALAAVHSVCAGIEVIDSRYADFRFRLPDVVADNASSAGFVLGGAAVDPRTLDLALEGCVLERDGMVVGSATGAATLSNPAAALALAANTLGRRGHALEEGWIVLTGALTEAIPLVGTGAMAASFTHLGTVGLRPIAD